MDSTYFDIIPIITLIIGLWAIGIVGLFATIMYTANKRRGNWRTSDVWPLLGAFLICVIAFGSTLICPYIILNAPSILAVLDIGLVTGLVGLTEVGIKHWRRMNVDLSHNLP